jgi:hypothetical protein|tara:strand:- start:30 stop:860 length:831 start_codon:yes stop_codon:yes gene_type:complete
MATSPRQQVDKLVIGTNDTSQEIGTSDKSPTGTLVANGPVVIGDVKEFGNDYKAELNVSSDSAEQLPFDQQPKLDVKLALNSDGNVKINGDDKTDNALDVTGDTILNGNERVTGDATIDGTTFADVQGTINEQSWKGFDIKHPSKEGHRLRYICLEGPEGGVYYRGRLKGSNIIELPEYWRNLVHEDSITVQLQPIGKNQNLVIESFNTGYVVVEIGTNQDFLTGEILIDCFYHVYGARKDGEVLIPEYKGETPEDYPGGNTQYSIAGHHYDKRTI